MFDIGKNLIPKPKEYKNTGLGTKIATTGCGNFTVKTESDEMLVKEGIAILKNKINEKICACDSGDGYIITVKVDENNPAFVGIDSDEAYVIDSGESSATLIGKSERGAFYACITLSQMLYAEGDSLMLAKTYLRDWPDFKKRGLSIESRYGTDLMEKDEWLSFIDYCAELKCNHIHIKAYNCWGVQYDDAPVEYLFLPIKKYPFLKTPKNKKYYSVKDGKWRFEDNLLPPMQRDDFLGDIIAYGKERGVTVCPALASYGHNTLLPRLIPEIAPTMKDGTKGKSGLCTSNPKTYEVLFDIFDEVIDRYMKPYGITEISAGLDEIGEDDLCQCEACKGKSTYERLLEHVIKLAKHLKARGVKTLRIDHDMFFKYYDKFEEMKERFIEEDVFDIIFICWWGYHVDDHFFGGKKDKVSNIFRGEILSFSGYFHWGTPHDTNENIRLAGAFSKSLGFESFSSYASPDKSFDKNFKTLADVAWNVEGTKDPEEFNVRYANINFPEDVEGAVRALRSMKLIMENDLRASYMNRMLTVFDPYIYSYRYKGDTAPQNYPGKAYSRIKEDEKNLLSYLSFIYEKATGAYEYFNNSKTASAINKVFLTTALTYKSRADEFLTLYRLEKSYNEGLSSAFEVIRELERLLSQKERLMALAEEYKSEANANVFLRNASMERQYMLDLKNYFKAELSCGNRPTLNLSDLTYATGKALEFLR